MSIAGSGSLSIVATGMKPSPGLILDPAPGLGFRGKALAKGWQYADWRQAFQEFVRNASQNSGHWSAGQYPRKALSAGNDPAPEAPRFQ